MFGKLKAAWDRLSAPKEAQAPEGGEPVEYKGYTIRPKPFRRENAYQTAGTIEKEIDGALRTHEYIRAETHQSLEDAMSFSVTKAQQMIDQQGDRIFR